MALEAARDNLPLGPRQYLVRPFSVTPCQTLIVRFVIFTSTVKSPSADSFESVCCVETDRSAVAVQPTTASFSTAYSQPASALAPTAVSSASAHDRGGRQPGRGV